MTSKNMGGTSNGPGRPAPETTKWAIYVKKTTKEALERAAGTGYNGASKAAGDLLDAIAESLPL